MGDIDEIILMKSFNIFVAKAPSSKMTTVDHRYVQPHNILDGLGGHLANSKIIDYNYPTHSIRLSSENTSIVLRWFRK